MGKLKASELFDILTDWLNIQENASAKAGEGIDYKRREKVSAAIDALDILVSLAEEHGIEVEF